MSRLLNNALFEKISKLNSMNINIRYSIFIFDKDKDYDYLIQSYETYGSIDLEIYCNDLFFEVYIINANKAFNRTYSGPLLTGIEVIEWVTAISNK